MNDRRLLLSLALTLLTAVSARAERGNPSISWNGESVDEMIAAFMQEHGVSGLSLAIVQAPYITRAQGYGLANQKTAALVGTHTVFNLGPMRNAFTAVAVLQLVEAGRLTLAEKFSDGRTLRDLLRDPAAYPLLEELIAEKSGKSYNDVIREGQIQRLGLRHTLFGSDLPSLQRESLAAGEFHREFLRDPALIHPVEPATGYDVQGNPVAPDPKAIYSTATDVSVWDIGLAGEILIKDPELRRILYHPEKQENGRTAASTGPWYFPGHPGLMISSGSVPGFSSWLSRFTARDELVCVTLLANRSDLDFSQLARRIAGAYNARIGPPPGTADLRARQSPFTVTETIDRLEKALRSAGVGIIGRINHQKAAAGAGLELRPTEELLFGAPANGTKLMQASPAITADLPLRAAAWEEKGAVWIVATDPVELARRHGVQDLDDLTQKMRDGIDRALDAAVSADRP